MSEAEITDEMLRDAIDAIARTRPGMLLYRYLQKVLMGVKGATGDITEGALRHDCGRRTLALELMSLMTEGINASGGPTATDRPVIFLHPKPAERVPFRGAGRRIPYDFDNGPAGGPDAA